VRRPTRAGIAVRCCLLATVVGACGDAEAGSAPAEIGDGRLVIQARDIAFLPAEVTMTSNTALTVVLDNLDAGIPHDVALYGGPDLGTRIAATDIVVGLAQADVTIPPIVPGRYRFTCTVHPNMVSSLTVIPPG
jgi:plastocyanin